MRLKLKSAVALGFEAALLQCRDVVVGYDPQRKEAASFLNYIYFCSTFCSTRVSMFLHDVARTNRLPW